MVREIYVYAVFIGAAIYTTNSFDDLAVAHAWLSQFDDEPNMHVRFCRVPVDSLV